MSKETNIVCECGLCCGTIDDWINHSRPSRHLTWSKKTVQEITQKCLDEIDRSPTN